MLFLQVGTAISVTHDRATPVGVSVRAAADVTSVEGRRVTFAVKAFDDSVRLRPPSKQRTELMQMREKVPPPTDSVNR
jgi:fluoroacetyl-CoA thioesterase